MKKLFLVYLLFVIHACCYAGDGDWAVFKINPALRKNANVVLRFEQLRFELINIHEAIYRNHYVVTILNEAGDQWAQFSERYDKLTEILSIDGSLYDVMGKELKRVKNKDIQDRTGSDDGNMMDDNRIKEHNFYYKVYPYTVEYEVVLKYKSTLFFPSWVPQGGSEMSVENSSITYEVPENYSIRYKAFNYKGEPVVATEKGRKTMTWSAGNMPAFYREPNQPPLQEITTYVYFAPTDFQVQSYTGNMSTWQDFGKFIYALKVGREKLPDNIKQKVHELTDNISDPREKIRILYEYMQQHTRYISVQLGIGGWQPFDASYVANKGYGDCKALTNYAYSLLKEAGINSYYTLIQAGRGGGRITESFPSQQFNHVILCVPLQKDTTWLECTSQTLPAGYLGDFTCDRYALLIDENGGKLIRTPVYSLKDNIEVRHISARLGEDGTLIIRSVSNYAGLQQDEYHHIINNLSPDKVKEYLHQQLDLATYDIANYAYRENKSSLPTIEEKLDIVASNYATITGKRLFIIPNIMTRTNRKFPSDSLRKYDLELGYAYKDVDSVEIELPEGYTNESMPQDVSLSGKFGKYSCSVKLNDNHLVYTRYLEYYGGRFPAADYGELVKYYDMIYKADRNKVVLVKKQ